MPGTLRRPPSSPPPVDAATLPGWRYLLGDAQNRKALPLSGTRQGGSKSPVAWGGEISLLCVCQSHRAGFGSRGVLKVAAAVTYWFCTADGCEDCAGTQIGQALTRLLMRLSPGSFEGVRRPPGAPGMIVTMVLVVVGDVM